VGRSKPSNTEVCPLTNYEEGIVGLHKGDSEAQDWLSTLKVHL